MQWNSIMIDKKPNGADYDNVYVSLCLKSICNLLHSTQTVQNLDSPLINIRCLDIQVTWQSFSMVSINMSWNIWNKSNTKSFVVCDYSSWVICLFKQVVIFIQISETGAAIKSFNWLLPILTCQNFDWPVITLWGIEFIWNKQFFSRTIAWVGTVEFAFCDIRYSPFHLLPSPILKRLTEIYISIPTYFIVQ